MRNLVLCLVVLAGMSHAGMVFQDTFENKTVGNNMVTGDAPTTGAHYWVNSYGAAASYYDDGGNIVLKGDRTDGKYMFSQAYGGGVEANIEENAEFKFSYDWKSNGALYSGPSVNFQFGQTSSGGAFSYAGGYSYYIKGAWYGTVPSADTWHTVEMVVRAGQANAGYVTPEYDVYADGVLLVSNVIGNSVAVGGNARLNLYVSGAGGVVLYDNVAIERVPEPATMALLGFGIIGLIRRKS